MLKGQKEIKRKGNISVKAVIPAAGLGTRFQPLTLAVPKELLPVNRKPLIQWALEEAIEAGIQEIGIVIRKGKEVIRDYLEALMSSSELLREPLGLKLSQANLHFVIQKEPLGLGGAIYEAANFVNDGPFVMIIPDQFVFSGVSATRQLLDVAGGDVEAVWSSVVSVSNQDVEFFPGARRLLLTNRKGNCWKVTGLTENTGHGNGDLLLGFGRTFFPTGTMEFFSNRFLNPETGEVDLLLSFEALIKKYQNYAVLLEGKAMDFGTWSSYEHFSQKLIMANREGTGHAR
ncbi:MAG: NTP transferase domain-containing protein [Desulfobacteraceae bacterium]|nr:NTP transferase domain-containing protein [Desulfobacteraceae bacterium]